MMSLILSAGAGSRLLPLTRDMPKCLVPVRGRAILDWQLEAMHAARMDGVVLAVGYRASQVASHLERYPPPLPVKLVFNPFWSVASSIGSVWVAREHLQDAFCIVNGDSIFDSGLIADAVAHSSLGFGLLVEPLDDVLQDEMLVSVTNKLVRAVGKDLARDIATHRSLGVVISKGPGQPYLQALDGVITSPGGTNAFHHKVVDQLANEVQVEAILAEGSWQEIDRPEDIDRWTNPGQTGPEVDAFVIRR